MLKQFIGRRINAVLWKDAYSVVDYWFKSVIMPLTYTIDAYRITVDESNNPVQLQRQGKIHILVEVRYQRALKFVEVFNDAYDLGMEFDSME